MSTLDLGLDVPLTNADVARMTRPEREARLARLLAESAQILDDAVAEHITADGRTLAATVVLFSGGNDSTTLAHMLRHRATHAGHANTTIGIEETRQFVRDCCAAWGLPLLERTPPRAQDHYRAQVLRDGFPGPAWHARMFTRLKERALEQIQRELVSNPRRERVMFVAGRRRDESSRRRRVPAMERKGSRVYASPLVNWTKLDLNTYRLRAAVEGDPVPSNKASDLIHMSGECLCGSFAAPGEREEVDLWFPAALDEVRELEALIADRDDIPEHRKTWGWGADPAKKALDGGPSASGILCSSCDDRFQGVLFA